ncbi:hypothetical protein LTR10_024271 [Elasticomyces elasticus]|nr:hypothetical protein LTR10_024271 [Elasticomyces elasticus]
MNEALTGVGALAIFAYLNAKSPISKNVATLETDIKAKRDVKKIRPILETDVGRNGALMRFLMRWRLLAAVLNHETGELQRDPKTGFVIENLLSEGGELLYRLDKSSDFQGYRGNPDATEKKLARDVRRKGDVWYKNGDALRRDSIGRWYSMDRLGDTYRWKSENVGTMEVSAAVGSFPGLSEAVIYGVVVPRHDGRACCARIYLPTEEQSTFDYTGLLTCVDPGSY